MISPAFVFISLALLNGAFAAPAGSVSSVSSHLASPTISFGVSESAVASATVAAPPEQQTVPPASEDPNPILWLPDSPLDNFEPIRGSLGATILGPHNVAMERENADLLIPPSSDSGSVPNSKWPFSLSTNRIQTGGWARQQNVGQMPVAKAMAGVNMRLTAGSIRELHWHNTAEWAYVLKGTVQVSAVDTEGRNFVDNVNQGDLWYFPPGIPHSLQATDDDPDGAEFLLVFDSGTFSEDSTFQLTDWLAHVPKEVLANNFRVSQSAFDNIPSRELYIFPSDPPTANDAPSDPQGTVPLPYTYKLSQQTPQQLAGGSVKVVDSRIFNISTAIAAAEVTVEPGAIRELHWHPTEDEWSFFLEGYARMTVFASGANSQTFNYQAGDIGYVPASQGHYIQNVGNTTLRYLEIWNSDKFEDISLNQWLALIPPALVKAHLDLSDETISELNKTKVTLQAPYGQ